MGVIAVKEAALGETEDHQWSGKVSRGPGGQASVGGGGVGALCGNSARLETVNTRVMPHAVGTWGFVESAGCCAVSQHPF